MEKKESIYSEGMKKQPSDSKKFKPAANTKTMKDKSLPWWVELLFVQIGLPDKLLIKILKANRNFKEYIKNDKKLIFAFLFFLIGIAYFYPSVKESRNKLYCLTTAKNYFMQNKNLNNINKRQLKMFATNFCNGGEGIDM